MASIQHYASLAIAPSTRQTSNSGQRRYFRFCELQGWPALPASDMMLSVFAAFLTGSVQPPTIHSYVSAVRTLHIELGYDDPTERAALLPRVLRGINRSAGLAPSKPRLPIIITVLRKLVDALLTNQLVRPHDKAMLHAAMLTAFHGFLRCAEFTCQQPFNANVNLTRGDITFHSGPPMAMSLNLKKSKTDPFSKGATVHIGTARKPYCAVSATLIYFLSTRGTINSPLFTFSNGCPLTRQLFVGEVRKLIVLARIPNANQFNGHSFRIGAATTAAAAHTPEWLVRTLGRWKSDAVLRYIRTDPSTIRGVASRLASTSI